MRMVYTTTRVRETVRGVAQFGRALRSGRRGRKFESCHLDSRPCSQAAKTSPSHGEGPGSIPGKVIKIRRRPDFLFYY